MLDHVFRSTATKLISIDIFDTLVFRTVRTPQEVFELMFENNPELFPDGFDKFEWRNIRVSMEMEARQHKHVRFGHREVTLKEIYTKCPSRFTKSYRFYVIRDLSKKTTFYRFDVIRKISKKV